jgi:hypothetical protein
MVLRIEDPQTERLARELHVIIARGRARPMLGERTGDEILGYDACGLLG